MHSLSAYHPAFWQLLQDQLFNMFLLFILHAPHHAHHVIPSDVPHRFRLHVRLLWRQVRWLMNRLPNAGKYPG